MPSIFLSYRRSDAPEAVARLYDRAIQRFGRSSVFRDVATTTPGSDFARVIEDAVGRCDVLVAIIGPGWLAARHPDGRRRLDDPNDWVRLEVAGALRRDIRVVPVLVAGAAPPAEFELPEELKPLARRQVARLSGTDGDVDDLLDGLARGPARWRAGAAVDAPADATSARFSPDGHHVTATKGAALWVWDFATGSTVLEWRPGRRFLDRIMPVLDIAFSPDGRHAATSFAPRVFLWDLARGSLVREVQHAADARQAPEILGFAPDGRLLTAVLTDGRRVIHGWSTSSGAESSRLVLERTLTYQLVDRGRRVLTCDPDGLVELRDLDGGEAAKWPTGMRRPVLAVSGDGRRCGATSGRHAAMFELTTGRWIAHVEDGSIGGTSIRLNHGGTHALLDRRVAVARSLWTAGGASSELRKVGWQSAFNADGRRLASASEEEVEIVDLPAAVTTASLLHRSPVSGIAFVAGGTELATRAREQGVRTFACDGGRQLDVLGQQLGYGQLIATEGGDRLAAPGGGSLRLWERVPA